MRDKRWQEHYEIVAYQDWGVDWAIKNRHNDTVIGAYSSRETAERIVRDLYKRNERELEKLLLGAE